MHYADGALPPRIAVVADEDTSNLSLGTTYRHLIQSISSNLVRRNIDVVNTGAIDRMELEYDRTATKVHYVESDLCKKYGTDAILMVHLEIFEQSKLSDGNCRVSLSLDSWGYDSRGSDIGVSTSKTSVVSRSNCEGAKRAAAQDLGYRAAMVFSGRWGASDRKGRSKDVIIIKNTGSNSGFD